jgi:hypothetical protein
MYLDSFTRLHDDLDRFIRTWVDHFEDNHWFLSRMVDEIRSAEWRLGFLSEPHRAGFTEEIPGSQGPLETNDFLNKHIVKVLDVLLARVAETVVLIQNYTETESIFQEDMFISRHVFSR